MLRIHAAIGGDGNGCSVAGLVRGTMPMSSGFLIAGAISGSGGRWKAARRQNSRLTMAIPVSWCWACRGAGCPLPMKWLARCDAPLDVFVVRKLGVPGHRELAMGAIASGGVRVLNLDVIDALGISPAAVESVADMRTAGAGAAAESLPRQHAVSGAGGAHHHRGGRRVGHRIHDASCGWSAAAEQSGAYYRRRTRGGGRNCAAPAERSRQRGLFERAARFSRRQHVVRGFFANQRRRGAQLAGSASQPALRS